MTRSSPPSAERVGSIGLSARSGEDTPLLSRIGRDPFMRRATIIMVIVLILSEAAAYAWIRREMPLFGDNAFRHLVSATINVTRTLLFAGIGLFLADRFPADRQAARNVVLAVVLAIGAAVAVHVAITQLILCNFPFIRGCPDLHTHLGLFSFVAPASFVATGYAVQLSREYVQRERETDRLHAGLLEAQVENLTMQLRPHFLFNTLNSVSVLLEKDPAAADAVLGQLTGLLRASLHTTTYLVPLREEIALTQAYAAIEEIRFGDRLEVEIAVSEEVLDWPVPHLLLQPLVENAVRHGASATSERGWIRISAHRDVDRLIITISNSGPGVPPDGAWMGVGLGITNTVNRLERLYGSEYGFALTSPGGRGTTATLTLPGGNTG